MVKMEVPARRDFVEPELRFEKYESIAFLPTDFGEEPSVKTCLSTSQIAA